MPVAGHHAGRPHADLAVLARRQHLARVVLDGQLDARHRQADAADPAGVPGIRRDERGRLGAPVTLVDGRGRHPCLELPPNLLGQRRGPGRDRGQLGQVGLLQRLSQQHLDHRGHQRAALDPVLLGQLHPAGRIEPAHQDGLGLVGPVHAAADDQQAVGVRQRERQHRADHVGADRHLVGGRTAPVQARVRERNALRPARRAAGVEQGGQVGARPVGDGPRLGRGHLVKVEHGHPGSGGGRLGP